MKRYIGIDYSLTSPAVAILGDDDSFQNSKISYLTSIKKNVGVFRNITGILHKDYRCSIERFENIATWVLDFTNPQRSDTIFLEDYSLGSSKGRTFDIAENTGILKYLLYGKYIDVVLVAPTSLKKTACGKGNGNKDAMYDAFVKKTGITLDFNENPRSDIVDAYFLAWSGYNGIWTKS